MKQLPSTLTILTLTDAAKVLNVHYKTALLWARENKIPAFRIGRTWMVREARLDQFIRQLESDGEITKLQGDPDLVGFLKALRSQDRKSIVEGIENLKAKGFGEKTIFAAMEFCNGTAPR